MLNYLTKQQQKGWSGSHNRPLFGNFSVSPKLRHCLTLDFSSVFLVLKRSLVLQDQIWVGGSHNFLWLGIPKESVLSLRRFTGSQHLETQTTVQSTLSWCFFCSFQGVWTLGLHNRKMLGMKYGWSKNIFSFLSWPRYWGHSEGQTVCSPSPVSYPFCRLKLWKVLGCQEFEGTKSHRRGNLSQSRGGLPSPHTASDSAISMTDLNASLAPENKLWELAGNVSWDKRAANSFVFL